MDKKEIGKKMTKAWRETPAKTSQSEKEQLWNSFASEAFPKKKSYKKWLYSGVAAILILALTAGLFLTQNNFEQSKNELAYTIIANPSPKIKAIFLPDSSMVELEPNAEIRYVEDFKNDRHLKLKGKAFFKVQKDRQHPFKVTCQETTTTVLGTSFTVNGNETNSVEVNLFEGKIQMNVDDMDNSWILAPGEQFIYKNKAVTVKVFERFQDFNDAEFSTVIQYIQATYGYSVAMPTEYLDTKITLRLNKKEPVKNVISIISQMSNLNPTIDDKLKKITFR